MQLDLTTESGLNTLLTMRGSMLLAGKRPIVEFVEPKRTPAQNNALHLWCEMVGACLNAAGLDMRVVLKPSVEIPWTKFSVKEFLWRPLQKAMTGKDSTTEPGKTEYPEITETLHRHIAAKHGVDLPPWPTRVL